MDLSTTYLGMNLKNPIVPSASPLSRSITTIRKMEDQWRCSNCSVFSV